MRDEFNSTSRGSDPFPIRSWGCVRLVTTTMPTRAATMGQIVHGIHVRAHQDHHGTVSELEAGGRGGAISRAESTVYEKKKKRENFIVVKCARGTGNRRKDPLPKPWGAGSSEVPRMASAEGETRNPTRQQRKGSAAVGERREGMG